MFEHGSFLVVLVLVLVSTQASAVVRQSIVIGCKPNENLQVLFSLHQINRKSVLL